MRQYSFPIELTGRTRQLDDGTSEAEAYGRGPTGEWVHFKSLFVVNEGSVLFGKGELIFKGRGKVTFQTVMRGYTKPSPMPDLVLSAWIYNVTGGDGEFQGALGILTSNLGRRLDCTEYWDSLHVRLFAPDASLAPEVSQARASN